MSMIETRIKDKQNSVLLVQPELLQKMIPVTAELINLKEEITLSAQLVRFLTE